MSAVKETVAPELINRIDELVVFDPLSLEAIEQITEHELSAVAARLSANGAPGGTASAIVQGHSSTVRATAPPRDRNSNVALATSRPTDSRTARA